MTVAPNLVGRDMRILCLDGRVGDVVRVMAVADNWAMVRRKGCIPFCLLVKDLVEITEETR